MLKKSRKPPLSKNEDTKAVRHFEENNYQGNDLREIRNKIDLSILQEKIHFNLFDYWSLLSLEKEEDFNCYIHS